MDQLSLDQQQTSLSASKSSTSLTSVDSEMSRHELASGGGIVASEDVFNRQMALREDQVSSTAGFSAHLTQNIFFSCSILNCIILLCFVALGMSMVEMLKMI